MQSGEFNCTRPAYGFRFSNGEMKIDETEAVVIRRIFNLYLQGFGTQAIANMLNEEAVPRRYDHSVWHGSTIKYILSNERYMGDALLQKNFTTETLPFRKMRNKGQLPKYYVENSTEDNALGIQVRIAEIDAEFKAMLNGVSSDTVDAFDDAKASALIKEKSELQRQLEQLQEIQQKRINTKHRLDDIYTILDGLKNRPMEYDDQMVRQILECVKVGSKEQITVIFIGGLEITQSLLNC